MKWENPRSISSAAGAAEVPVVANGNLKRRHFKEALADEGLATTVENEKMLLFFCMCCTEVVSLFLHLVSWFNHGQNKVNGSFDDRASTLQLKN
jgi:hypothetical protein